MKHDGEIDGLNVEDLSRHINLLAHYYDRGTPLILIREAIPTDHGKGHKPIRMIEGSFPDSLLMTRIDDIVLQLLEVARTSNVRSAYLYYYQIFEYAGYYYIDEKARKSLRNALRDPALIACGEDKVSELFSIFTDLNHSDEAKMRKVIEDHCDPRVIWTEVSNDIDFYSKEQQFDGGFTLPALVSKDCTDETWKTMWMPKTFDVLTKIRNALVHAREKRENKVILPTLGNNARLARYLPVIQRMAEQLALKS